MELEVTINKANTNSFSTDLAPIVLKDLIEINLANITVIKELAFATSSDKWLLDAHNNANEILMSYKNK